MLCSRFVVILSLYFTSVWSIPLGNDDNDNKPEPAVSERRQGDLTTDGTFPINIYANSPYGAGAGLGGLYGAGAAYAVGTAGLGGLYGVGAGTGYGVGAGTGYGVGAGFGGGAGYGVGAGYGALYGGGLNQYTGSGYGLNGLNNYGGYTGINSLGVSGFNGLSGLGGFNSYGLGGLGGYGAGNYGGIGGLYSSGGKAHSLIGGKLAKVFAKFANRNQFQQQGLQGGQIFPVIQGIQDMRFSGPQIPYNYYGSGFGGLESSYGYGFGNQFGVGQQFGGLGGYNGGGLVG